MDDRSFSLFSTLFFGVLCVKVFKILLSLSF
jgi:hypothetical protein